MASSPALAMITAIGGIATATVAQRLAMDHPGLVSRVCLREHDDADRAASRRIGCPVLFLWAAKDDLEDLYGDPLAIWRDWADDLRGQRIDCGHHIAEEAPAELASHLAEFFAPVPGPS